jgi:hypothetical protein
MPPAGIDPRARELAHVRWGRKYYDEGAYDKALAHVGRALHYGVARKQIEQPHTGDSYKLYKPNTPISKHHTGVKNEPSEKCAECKETGGPFHTYYYYHYENGEYKLISKILCKKCYRNKVKYECEMCKQDDNSDDPLNVYIDRESENKHVLCSKCHKQIKEDHLNLELLQGSRSSGVVNPESQVDLTKEFNNLSIHGSSYDLEAMLDALKS